MGDRSNQIGLAITLLLGCVIHIVIGQRGDPTPKTFDSGNNVRLRVNNLKRPEIEKAKYYFQMAAATYCTNRTRLANWTCAYCPRNGSDIRLVTFLEDKLRATFGFVAVDSLRNEILVSFRGSANLKNFIEDFLFPPVPMPREDPRIQVHAGFYTTAMSLYNQVVSALRTLLRSRPNYRVVLTGHSLGGSIAALTTFRLISSRTFPTAKYELFTYGEPRQGNRAYATKFNSWSIPSARVVNYGDLVPHLPPSTFGYFHHQNELWIYRQESSEARYCSQTVYEDPQCSNSLGPIYNATDHLSYFGVTIDANC